MVDRTAILIPIRGGSKGIPNKAFVDVCGKPLMDYTIEKALKLENCDVWVSSDSDEILQHSYKMGCKTIKRPGIYANDTASLESVIDHFTDVVYYNYLMMLQITSPLLRFDDINKSLNLFKSSNYDSCFSVYSLSESDVLFWDTVDIKPINYDPYDRGIRQNRDGVYAVETGGFYITTRRQFLISRCRLGGKISFYKIPFWTSFEVDTFEDLENIRRLMT